MTLNRRKLLGAGLVGAAALAGCGGASTNGETTSGEGVKSPAIQRKKKKLTMVTTWPKGLPGLGDAADRLAARVGELTEGSLDIKVYAAGELVPALEAFDAVSTGAADMYHGAEYYWQGKSRAFAFFTAIPMGMTAQEQIGWIEYGGGKELWHELSSDFNVIAFQCANTTHQMGGWFRKEVNSLDDFKGLKMRIPGLGGQVVRELGGAAETLPGGEIFQALQTGAIDATEWVGPWNDRFLGFYRVAPYHYGPGFHEPGSALAVGINKDKWNSFTPTEQKIIEAVASEVTLWSIGEFTYQNGVTLEKMIANDEVKLRQFPDDVMREVNVISKDVRAEAGAQGGIEQRVYESYEKALKTMRGWSEVSEGPYYRARALDKA